MISKYYLRLQRWLSSEKAMRYLPRWMQSSSIQQGILFGGVTLISLLIMAFCTYFYVDYELSYQNQEIVAESSHFIKGSDNELDDDPIEEDDVLTILVTGFTLAGVMASLVTAWLVFVMARINQKKIGRIERVLHLVAEGKLSARIGGRYQYDDISRISIAVNEMLARLEGTVAAMSDISANIAHELKTPITRLRHNLLTLKQDVDSDGMQVQALQKDLDCALDESERLASIFDALLRISQIESGARRSRFAEIDLSQIMEIVSEIYTDVAEDAGMRLIYTPSQTPVKILGDKELLIQQVANLIENALRYCPASSMIKISVGFDALTRSAWIQVEDNGPGIAENERERVFERLYRVDKSRTDGGLGLGLSLAKAVAGLHYGKIELYDCNPGLGIKIKMPLRGMIAHKQMP